MIDMTNTGFVLVNTIQKETIEAETDRRKLLALAYRVKADVEIGIMPPDEYTECVLILASKLGFAITLDNLEKAATEVFSESTISD